ncbi:MAG: 1-deoxy-D-xylulose-5-phosphate synthase [Simkaniaceae bacterium]
MTNTSLLDSIHSPEDIKDFSIDQLKELAAQIHSRILDVMAVNGGHLASNLGSIELTLALHKVFHSPKDKFLFDVSHQIYTHKLLTGRNLKFHTIRKYQGLSGFAHPAESIHDHFYAGHAGTALSVALGMAKTRDLNHRKEHIIPIIGDASLTCGHTLEALNNIKKDIKNFIVILNDNAMSISKNVGNITGILSRMINNPTSNRMYQDIANFLYKIPAYGEFLAKQGHRIKESIKNLVSTAPFFEEFGLAYVGPINGHDLKKLIDVLEASQNWNRPVLIHVLTEKGHGMPSAADNPISYHGVKPFDRKTGKFFPGKNPAPTFPKIFGKQVLELAEEDSDVIAVTPAMPVGSCLVEFMKKFPERCIDVGIAEGHSIAYCGGISFTQDKKVICSIYATFLQRAFDQVFQEVCLQNLPVVFAIDRSGIAGGDGITHNGIYDLGFLRTMPNMVIAQPRNGRLLRELLQSAFTWKRPASIRYPNLPTSDEPASQYRPLGKGEILQEGKEIAIIGLGHMLETVLEVSDILQSQGIRATVIDPIFVKPLDENLLQEICLTHKFLITVEEHSLQTGLGSAINQFVIEQGFTDLKIKNFGIGELFLEHGSHKELIESIGLDAKSLAENINCFVCVHSLAV